MHEYSLVEALLERVQVEARRAGAVAVRAVTVRLGDGAGVDGGLLATAFEVCREQTLCAQATLTIEPVPTAWACPRCRAPVPEGGPLQCPGCQEPAQLVAGDELLLARVELEVPEHV